MKHSSLQHLADEMDLTVLNFTNERFLGCDDEGTLNIVCFSKEPYYTSQGSIFYRNRDNAIKIWARYIKKEAK